VADVDTEHEIGVDQRLLHARHANVRLHVHAMLIVLQVCMACESHVDVVESQWAFTYADDVISSFLGSPEAWATKRFATRTATARLQL